MSHSNRDFNPKWGTVESRQKRCLGVAWEEKMAQSALCAAAGRGDLSAIKRLLGKGVDPHGPPGLHNALHEAARKGQPESVRFLLDAIDPDLPSDTESSHSAGLGIAEGATPLTLAAGGCSAEHLECVQALLARGANPLARDRRAMSAMMVAAVAGNVPGIHLLGQVSDHAQETEKGSDALALACLHARREAVALLRCDTGAAWRGAPQPLPMAVLDALLNRSARKNTAEGQRADDCARADILRDLLPAFAGKEALIDAHGLSCLAYCANNGLFECVKVLLPFAQELLAQPMLRHPISLAGRNQNFEIVDLLLDFTPAEVALPCLDSILAQHEQMGQKIRARKDAVAMSAAMGKHRGDWARAEDFAAMKDCPPGPWIRPKEPVLGPAVAASAQRAAVRL